MPHVQRSRHKSNEELEDHIFVAEKEKHIKRRSQILSDGDEDFSSNSSPASPALAINSSLADSEVSAGAVPSPKRSQNRHSLAAPEDDEAVLKAVNKKCEYVGSFSVAHLSPSSRAEFVRLQLQTLQSPDRSRQVALCISLSGIKVCEPEDDTVVLMAHALKRVSYSTCDPDFKQFAFLARNPKGPVGVQYCHVFITAEKYEVEEINAIVSKAFKVAYASIRSKKQFYKLVDELNKEQEEYQSQVNKLIEEKSEKRVTPEELAEKQPLIAPERVRGFGVGQSRVWAKQEVGRVPHKQPHLIAAGLEVNSSPELENSDNNNLIESSEQIPISCQDSECSFQDMAPTSQSGNLKPSAPLLSVGESHGQQEVIVRQTQRTKALPPAPYYEAEVSNDWATMDVVPPSGISVVAESEGGQSCHILLQNEQSPPALAHGATTFPVNGRFTGQILLQDSSVPPPFNYKPRNGTHDEYGRQMSWEDGVDRGYFEDSAMNEDTVCLLNDEEDEENFRYQMKCAEQFINATFDIDSTDDELDYPWRPPFSSDDEDEDEVDKDAHRRDTDRKRENDNTEIGIKEKIIRGDYAVPRPATRAIFACDPYPDDNGIIPQRDKPLVLSRQEETIRITDEAPNINISSQTSQLVPSNNENTNEPSSEKVCNKPKGFRYSPEKRRAPPPPLNNLKSCMDKNGVDNLQVCDDHSRGRSQSSEELGFSRDQEARQNSRPKSRSDEALNSRFLYPSDNKENGQHYNCSSNERRKRAPGHMNHKVEIEIGQFRVRKTPTSERGRAPPLPPRSSSLHEHSPGTHGSSNNIVPPKTIPQEPWFKAGIPKEIAFEILRHQEKGAFIVRESRSHPGCYAVSIKVDRDFNDSNIANYLVVRTKNGGYTIKGFGRDFPDLPRLVHYYSFHQDQLPCKLVFSGTNPLYNQDGAKPEENSDDEDEDPDYRRLTDYRSMLP